MSHITVQRLARAHLRPNGERLEALCDVSFEVERGGFVSFVGPSGCGKTTLLNLIAGIDAPTSGEIRIHGPGSDPGEGPSIGFVFQQPRLLPWRTVWRNVALPLEGAGVPDSERRARIRRYLDLVGLQGFEDYYPGQISGGMQQRVSLARALVIEPEMLLMDEPLSSLDALTAERLRGELVRIWSETGKTILFVTHNLSEAVFLSQRVYLMGQNPGRIAESVRIDLPYPRTLDDERFFEWERRVRRRFEAAVSNGP